MQWRYILTKDLRETIAITRATTVYFIILFYTTVYCFQCVYICSELLHLLSLTFLRCPCHWPFGSFISVLIINNWIELDWIMVFSRHLRLPRLVCYAVWRVIVLNLCDGVNWVELNHIYIYIQEQVTFLNLFTFTSTRGMPLVLVTALYVFSLLVCCLVFSCGVYVSDYMQEH
jgi:hypothetical protein